jgi:hypothetical protein
MVNLRYLPGTIFEVPRQSQSEQPVLSPLTPVSLPVPRRVLNRRILPTTSLHKRMTHTNCCIYIVVLPDDEQ